MILNNFHSDLALGIKTFNVLVINMNRKCKNVIQQIYDFFMQVVNDYRKTYCAVDKDSLIE